VDGVDLKVRSGSIYGVLGPNGAGKTTTIRMLATLLRPDAGSASIFGYDVVKEPHPVRQLIGVTGQYASVDESLSAWENLMLFSRLHGFGRDKARQRSSTTNMFTTIPHPFPANSRAMPTRTPGGAIALNGAGKSADVHSSARRKQ